MTGVAEMNPELAGFGKSLSVILHYPIFSTSPHPSELRFGRCFGSPPIPWGGASLEVQFQERHGRRRFQDVQLPQLFWGRSPFRLCEPCGGIYHLRRLFDSFLC